MRQRSFIMRTPSGQILLFQKSSRGHAGKIYRASLGQAFRCTPTFIALRTVRRTLAGIECFMKLGETRAGFFGRVMISIQSDVAAR